MSVSQIGFPQLENPEDKQKLYDAIKNCADSYTRIASENDLVRETIKNISKELGVPKKIVTKLAKVYFKQNYDEEVTVQEQFETIYNEVVNN